MLRFIIIRVSRIQVPVPLPNFWYSPKNFGWCLSRFDEAALIQDQFIQERDLYARIWNLERITASTERRQSLGDEIKAVRDLTCSGIINQLPTAGAATTMLNWI
jgi:hypothetical protein